MALHVRCMSMNKFSLSFVVVVVVDCLLAAMFLGFYFLICRFFKATATACGSLLHTFAWREIETRKLLARKCFGCGLQADNVHLPLAVFCLVSSTCIIKRSTHVTRLWTQKHINTYTHTHNGTTMPTLASLLFYLAKCEKSNVKYVASVSHSLWCRHPNQISVADCTFAELFMGFDVRIVYKAVAAHIPSPTLMRPKKKMKRDPK